MIEFPMPYSSDHGKYLVDRAVQRIARLNNLHGNPVIDIGAGSGTYSKRYRKQLNVEWIGVEIWEPYVEKFGLKSLYDKVEVTDAISYIKSQPEQSFSVCFLGDVVEHLSMDDAEELVSLAIARADVVIISIPIVPYPQGEYDGNPHEAHLQDWSHELVLEKFERRIAFWGIEEEIGVYVLSRRTKLYEDLLRPMLGAYLICKDEATFIGRCLKSISDFDEIVVVDTGSTDGTFEKLLDMSNDDAYSNIEVKQLSVQPWRFDDARNAALSFLSPSHDMCLSIDADEILAPGNYQLLVEEVMKDLQAGRVKDRYIHRFSTIWDWESEGKSYTDHWHERIHARRGFHWKLPVHEVLVKGDGTPEVQKWLGGIKLTQLPDGEKSRPYLPLLEQAIKEDPTRWKLHAFKGADLAKLERYYEAGMTYRYAMTLPGADRGFLHLRLGELHERLGELPAAEEHFRSAAELLRTREGFTYMARFKVRRNELYEAKLWYSAARKEQTPQSGYGFDPGCWGEAFDQESAL